MAESRGFFRRRPKPEVIEPIRVGDVVPAGGRESAQDVAGRVGDIIAAAQANAEEIERLAREDAERIRAEALAEGEAHIQSVRAATAAIERRAAALEEAVETLVAGLGRGAEQLDAELAMVAGQATELPVAPTAEIESAEPDEEEPAAETAAEPDTEPDTEGARLVALDQALEGRDRDELKAELGEQYPGVDVEAVLEDVFGNLGETETPGDAPRSAD